MRADFGYPILTKIKQKCLDQSGESLGEVLVALLVSSLALLMLAGVISASGHMTIQNKDKMNTYYEKNNEMVRQKTVAASGEVTVTETKLIPSASSYSVKYYVNDTFDKKIISYSFSK